ncbi:MAG: type I 3-dehydroquinate dehydratase [Candidatus Thorarchaeota archaeon]
MTRLCVCLTEKTSLSCSDFVKNTDADLIEHRMDFMNPIQGLSEIYSSTEIPIIATCRSRTEGGFFKGKETQRINHLIEAVKAGASFVDVEVETKQHHFLKIRDVISTMSCQLIMSKHYSEFTPRYDKLVELIQKMQRTDADILKIVVTPQTIQDCIHVLQLYADEKIETPLISFGMGDRWKFTRVVALLMGAPFMYVSQDTGQPAASGQISLSEMRRILEVLS